MLLKIVGNEAKKSITWTEFKTLVLGTRDQMKAIYTKIGMKPTMLRSYCSRQIQDGKGIDMYFETQRQAKLTKKAKDDVEESDD
jgi:hypothetical protein